MKQYITLKQLFELKWGDRNKLNKWWNPKEGDLFWDKGLNRIFVNSHNNEEIGDRFYDVTARKENGDLPILSIGQMIEFLGLEYWTNITYFPKDNETIIMPSINAGVQPEILCDTLWNAVKNKLQSEEH